MSPVTVRVPAKVNLQLSVGPLRDDGYHDLVNVFHAVSLFDEVTASEDDGFPVTAEGEDAAQIPVGDGNLAVRAARGLAASAGIAGGAALHIRKEIPIAGGMAGGSADAAAALVACDALWGTGADLFDLAARVGSDVPFALMGGTAVGLGRGERLTPVPVNGTFHWVFALADGGLSTPRVYAECDRLRAETGGEVAWPRVSDELLRALKSGDAVALGESIINDLQPAALALRPELGGVLDAGREHGALGAIVSGSGPTCAFLASSDAHAREVAAGLQGRCRRVVRATGPAPGAMGDR